MRLAAAGFGHRANTFASARATIDVWQRSGILEGNQIREQHRSAGSTMAGFLAYEAETADELVPLVYSRITSTGASTREAYEYLCDLMIGELRIQGPWDGVLLSLHGAAVAEHRQDADGEFVRRVRAAVGPLVPIGVTLGIHANLSRQLVAAADVITVHQTTSHVDAAEQGLACARLIGRTVRGEIQPAMALVSPPLVANILRHGGTAARPMAGLVRLAREHQQRRRVLSVSVVGGFPYADVAHMGMSFVAVTDNDPVLAKEITGVLAVAAWDRRAQMVGKAPSPDEALQRAADAVSAAGPVVILDMGDNVLAGGSGDSTHLLHAARRLGITGVAVSICDPAAVAACAAVGPGGRVQISMGGKTDGRHGAPFPITGQVVAIADGSFEDPAPTSGGTRHFDLGRSASVRSDDGYVFAIHSRPAGALSQEQFRTLGIEPKDLEIIAAKGVRFPRAVFEPIATKLIWANTPGVTSADLSTFAYKHRRSPMYPYEPDTVW